MQIKTAITELISKFERARNKINIVKYSSLSQKLEIVIEGVQGKDNKVKMVRMKIKL